MEQPIKKTCKECNLWDIEAAKDKAGRIRKDKMARCLWVSTEIFPLSVFEVFVHRQKSGYMQAQDGEGCKCFLPRGK